MKQTKKFVKKYRKSILVSLFVIVFAVGVVVGSFFLPQRSLRSATKRTPIYPSIYITGSDGKTSTMDPMVSAMVADKETHAKRGLVIVVNTDNDKLTVTGKISENNHYPTIEVGMVKGTNNSLKYERALKDVMSYLGSHYNVSYANVLGFSAGGAGTYRYLLQYGYDRSLPPVKKFLSLDGQYNASTAQPTQTLDNVLQNGPVNQTKYYQYWTANYEKLDPSIQVVLLAGDFNQEKETDGVVPWADAFSIYPLLRKNGNPVEYYVFKGNNTYHADVPKNAEAINYVKVFFYE